MVQQLIYNDENDFVYAVGFDGVSKFHLYQINAKNGELLKHNSAAYPGGFSGEMLLVTKDRLVTLDSSRSTVVAIEISEEKIVFEPTQVSDLQDVSGTAVLLPAKLAGIFAVKVNTVILFVKVTNFGKLELVDKLDHTVAVSDALSFSEGQQAFALVQHEGSKIDLTIKLNNDWSSNLLKESINMDQDRGVVQKMFINNYIRTDRSYGFRALLVMEDHSLLLVQQGEIVWSREDSLASVIDVTTSELPVEKDGVSVAKVEHSLFDWLQV